MTYEKYLGYSRQTLLEKVQAVMSPKRFNHVLGVERAAIHLAEKNGYDTEKAGLAGLLHDYAKELPPPGRRMPAWGRPRACRPRGSRGRRRHRP